jgi:hypothetical protein
MKLQQVLLQAVEVTAGSVASVAFFKGFLQTNPTFDFHCTLLMRHSDIS